MKKLNKHNNSLKGLFLLFAFIVITSCTNQFDELNIDPNAFNSAAPENLFAGSVKSTLDLVGGHMNDQMFMMYASYYGGKGGQFPNFFYNENQLDNWWRQFYVDCIKNNQEIIDKFSDNLDYKNRVLIAKIWKSYIYSVLVSTFGGVPYEEASLGLNATNYSTEEYIYTDILNLLKEAGENIDLNGDQLLPDPIFNGNNQLWIKFANSLRLKIALRISEGFPTLAEQHGTEVIQNEDALINVNAENAVMKWGSEQQNWSFNYDRYIFVNPQNDIVPNVNFHYMLNLKTYRDPRLFEIIEPSSNPIQVIDSVFESGSTEKVRVRYELAYFGRPLGGNGLVDGWNLNQNDNILNGIPNQNYCRPKTETFMAQDMSFNIITASEMYFIRAEAQLKGWGGNRTAEQYYTSGIANSFAQYGVASKLSHYLQQDGVKWGTSSLGDKDLYSVQTSGISANPLDKIVRQRWLASFNQGHDIWCLQKRTRMLPIIAHFSPDGSTGLDWSEIPERMVYPPLSESGFNNVGFTAAVSLLQNGNTLLSPLQMNKPFSPINYTELLAEFNQDFATNFYGPSEDDLIAAGVTYTKL